MHYFLITDGLSHMHRWNNVFDIIQCVVDNQSNIDWICQFVQFYDFLSERKSINQTIKWLNENIPYHGYMHGHLLELEPEFPSGLGFEVQTVILLLIEDDDDAALVRMMTDLRLLTKDEMKLFV